ncbi:bifunctional DNA-binding transcriptional regulator/O6-methylguanine-DNA methyltransferase Ada [Acidovorax sp. SUPP3334]|uniref:bifunctional DNA-binding transcriptional regulator/O6-methylguanine-DNA methyltransferase Ada n=1 Tax=Acidovorax sp. SUPP3334 TaxID=2920881 RepID=UPI0023DE4E6D|nr:bifunctional DNA-binding transcriptional regulator/O6-methylguanine-DNA methyltransferase Ada [Acidovorax sp. SUPP3334]GKT26421.1 bifunctional DNA-binding transcriptional regulator/O6-methylguanine-DNA methyltransferase Ada [Acidovorax sp. SUPP3334]
MNSPTGSISRAQPGTRHNARSAAAQRAAATLADPRWAAVAARDAQADGCFVYSVRTTGVFCRPSCAARPARPENVDFHATAEAAERAGFRPCRRCHPDQPVGFAPHATTVARLCRLIETTEPPPPLAELAQAAGLSPHHLHRVFKAATGLTPRAYAAAHRAAKLRDGLAGAGTVTEAVYAAGYGSQGRFYEEAGHLLGMSPSRYRSGGAQVRIRFAVGQCSLGAVLAAASERGLCALLLGDDPDALVRELQDRFPRAELLGADAAFERWMAQVIGFVDAPASTLSLPLDVQGTVFQQRVWTALQAIPPGHTASYAQIAERIGAPRAVRAVAQACAANALAVAIPCHRVVRTDGALSGYRWGVERKRALLDKEATP